MIVIPEAAREILKEGKNLYYYRKYHCRVEQNVHLRPGTDGHLYRIEITPDSASYNETVTLANKLGFFANKMREAAPERAKAI